MKLQSETVPRPAFSRKATHVRTPSTCDSLHFVDQSVFGRKSLEVDKVLHAVRSQHALLLLAAVDRDDPQPDGDCVLGGEVTETARGTDDDGRVAGLRVCLRSPKGAGSALVLTRTTGNSRAPP